MTIRTLARFVALTCLSLSAVGCIQPKLQYRTTVETISESSFTRLNQDDAAFEPGVFYSLTGTGARPVLDLRDRLPAGDSPAWFRTRELRPARDRVIGQVDLRREPVECPRIILERSQCEPVERSSPLVLRAASAEVKELIDPTSTLEILNRPLTGLAHHRTAEERIALWRSMLATAISDAAASEGTNVVLCTSTTTFRDPSVEFDSEAPFLPNLQQVSSSLAREVGGLVNPDTVVESGPPEEPSYVAPVLRSVVVGAQCREVAIVNSVPFPAVAFGFLRNISMSLKELE
jgi:hypothetical protein